MKRECLIHEKNNHQHSFKDSLKTSLTETKSFTLRQTRHKVNLKNSYCWDHSKVSWQVKRAKHNAHPLPPKIHFCRNFSILFWFNRTWNIISCRENLHTNAFPLLCLFNPLKIYSVYNNFSFTLRYLQAQKQGFAGKYETQTYILSFSV